MSEPTVSRRQVLTWAGVALGVAAVELGPAGPAAAAPAPADDLVLEPLGGEPVAVLSAEGGAPAAVPRQLAVRVARTIDLPTGARIAVTFDPRVHTPLAPAVVSLDGRAVPATAETTVDRVTGLHTSTITLTGAVPAAGELIVVVGTAHPLLYPRDLVRRPATATARVRLADRAAETKRSLSPARPSAFGGRGTPWGLQLDGVWSARSWGDDGRYVYWVPIRVSLRGAGPGRSPDASFSVSLDPRLVRSVKVEQVRLTDKPYRGKVTLAGQSRSATIYRTEWNAPARLGADEVLDVSLSVATVLPSGPLAGVTHPVVAVHTIGDTAARRHTGRESISRLDSVLGDTSAG